MAFLVFEGIDGAGKSTLIQGLANHLKSKGIEHLITREPGGSALGDDLRELLLRKNENTTPCPKAELLIYMAIRAQHVEQTIKPALKQKKWVLCDRYTYSSLAFQAGGRQLDEEPIHWLNQYSTGGLLPDMWVLLDLDPHKSLERMRAREAQGQERDRFESEKDEFHHRVRDYYLQVARGDKNCLVLNASEKKEALIEKLIANIEKQAKEKKWPV